MLLWLLVGGVVGALIGAGATWAAMRGRTAAVLVVEQPVAPPEPEPEPAPDRSQDMGRTAEAMLADLERKFEAMRRAEAEKAARTRRKPPSTSRGKKPGAEP